MTQHPTKPVATLTREEIENVYSFHARVHMDRLKVEDKDLQAMRDMALASVSPRPTSEDEVVTKLYRRFKEWSKRGFGPDDVTWCEVKADIIELINLTAHPEAAQPQEDRATLQLIDERDAAEEALSQAYYLITGRSPEWSNLFGHKEALEEIDDAQRILRQAATLVQEPTAQHTDGNDRELPEGYSYNRTMVYLNCPNDISDSAPWAIEGRGTTPREAIADALAKINDAGSGG